MIVYKKRAQAFFFKILIVSIAFILISVIFAYFGQSFFGENSSKEALSDISGVTVIIDPGHGGADGGAESSGVFEKDLNLLISKKICEILSYYNVDYVLTRQEDVMLSDENATHKKQSDLLNRTKLSKNYPSPVFVSVHMNKFPEARYSGLQVFYSLNHPDSKTLADSVQSNVISLIQNDNTRKIKGAGSSIFVLDRLECPAILIECGFMSNEAELSLLCDGEYQTKLAFVIACSIIDYISK